MIQILKKQIPKHFKKHRNVNTWSALATAFNTITKEKFKHHLKKETVSCIHHQDILCNVLYYKIFIFRDCLVYLS